MRSGANSVQHLLTPAALGVLKHAVTEARRRGHPQVQPLHVVSMLLTHAGSRLRQACMLSHPQNAQTPECRALEVCFNVALDHLPQAAVAMTGGGHASQPQLLMPQQPGPNLSNALMAALKRAHAHQRRGCPEHQQSPLLAVKVEIDQLIISILDDPSVSRVMKEAGFSSTNVKFNLEDGSSTTATFTGALATAASPTAVEALSHGVSFYDGSPVMSDENETKSTVKFPTGACATPAMSWPQSEVVSRDGREAMFRTKRVILPASSPQHSVNPALAKDEDVQKLFEIFLRPRNKNAILVGDAPATANATLDDLAGRIKTGTVPTHLQGLQFLDPKLSSSSFGYCSSLEMEQKLAELSKIVAECMPAGAILHIGDLQWLAEPMQLKKGPSNFCPAQRTASELRQLLIRHAGSRLWFVGVATSHVFSRLQALYPSLTSDWGLEPVQVSPLFQPSHPSFLQRFASIGNDQSATLVRAGAPVVTPVAPAAAAQEESDERFQCCADCLAKFEEEKRLIHENESLSLQLAPVKWFSLSTDDASSGVANGSTNQVKSRSVVQQLSQLQQTCQKTCRMLHGEPVPVPALHESPRPQQRLLQSPLSRLSTSSRDNSCGLGSQWLGPDCRQQQLAMGSSVVDQPVRSEPLRTSSAPVQEAAVSAADTSAASPKGGSSVDSGPEDHEDPNGSTGTSVQDAALASIHTNLVLGRANDSLSSELVQRAPPNPSPLQQQQQSVTASPLSLKNGGKPLWMLQTPSPLRTSPLQSPSPLQSSSPLRASLLHSSPLQSSSPLRASPLQSSSPLGASPLQSSSPLRASPLQSSSPMRASPLQSSSPMRASPLQSASPLRASPLQPSSPMRASPLQSSSQIRASPLQSSPLQQRLVKTTTPGGVGWQSSSPLAKRNSLQARPKSPSPPPVADSPFKEITVDDSLKGLYKGLMKRVPWQAAAVAGISATVMRSRSGMGSFRGATAKTDTWLLLLGPDPVAKRVIAKALAELVFGGERSLLHVGFAEGSTARLEAADNGVKYRGLTPMDRLVDAVRVKKSAVIFLEDVDLANNTVRKRLVRAMEIGKLADSDGRESNFGNTIVVMTTSIGSAICEPAARPGCFAFSEAKLAALSGRMTVCARVKDSRSPSANVIHLHGSSKSNTHNVEVVDNGDAAAAAFLTGRNSNLVSLAHHVPSWVRKRKPQNGELRLKLGVKRARNPAGDGRFLNLDLNLATGEGNRDDCDGDGDDEDDEEEQEKCDSEEAKLQTVLAEARYTLSDRFCALPDYAVGFNAFDFNGLALEVVDKLGKSFATHAARDDAALEIDVHLLERVVAAVWKMPGGRSAFHAWLEDVFAKSIAAATAAPHAYSSGCVVEFTADPEHESGNPDDDGGFDPSATDAALPHKILFFNTHSSAAAAEIAV